MARIVIMFKDKVQREIKIGKDRLRVGRDADNDIRIDNPAVSRRHAEIFRDGYAFYVEDKQSTNGTAVNDQAVTWKAALNHNDRITIGKHTLLFLQDPGDYAEEGGKPMHPDATIIVPKDDRG